MPTADTFHGSGTRRAACWLIAIAIAALGVAAVGVPLIPTSPCLPPATPLPRLALISLGGLLVAAFAGVSSISVLLSESEGSLRNRLVMVLGVTATLGTPWVGVALLALARTNDWSCAGG